MTLLLLVLLPFLGAIPPLVASHARAGRTVVAWSAAAPAVLALILLLVQGPAVFGGEVVTRSWPWLPALGLNVTIRLDGLAWLFAFLVLAIGLLILLYARYYLSDRDPMGRFYFMLMLFMGSMLGLVVTGDLLLMVVFWELTSLSSFLLIGYWTDNPAARRGARMALAVTGAGGLALLAGVLLLAHMVGSFDLGVVLASGDVIREHALYRPALALVLLGAFAKSAQFPFHFWLPRAMAAPTPVSAYLHSATMVKAGVFLLARLYPALAGTSEWFLVVTGVGMITMLLGAYTALFEHDLKGLLAYSTISQLGLITLLFGFSSQLAAVAAVFHIINHATFKASLFMAAGIIDHEAGTRDIRVLNGLYRYMPYTGTLAIVAASAMAGVPLLNGFLSKEMFFAESLVVRGNGGWLSLIPVGAAIGGAFSVAYSARFVHDVFFGGPGTGLPRTPHEPPRWMRIPVEVLVVLCVLVGVAPVLVVRPVLDIAVASVLAGPVPYYSLDIWHGLNLPLLMTVFAMIAGISLYAGRRTLFAAHDRVTPAVTAEGVYDAIMARLGALARGVTGALETGSLQRYVALFLGLCVVVGFTPALRHGLEAGPLPVFRPDVASLAAWLILLAGTLMTAILHRRRLFALIAISVVGLMVSLTFVRLSAPDLALTQLLVEIVTILLILLALKYLPPQTPIESTRLRRWRDLGLAGLAGGGTAALVWAVLTRPHESISQYFLAESKPSGGGTNVVNVILVDFRGFDTFGEITVLGIAALGVIMLLGTLNLGQGLAAENQAPDRHPVILATITRALLPLSLLMAVYIFLRGHNLPGGGFIAGLVAAVALIMQYLGSGVDWTSRRLAVAFQPWIGVGLLVAALTGVAAMVLGYPFLTSAFDYFHLPVIGEFELASAMAFDVGVFLTVVAVVMLILARLGNAAGRIGPERDKEQEARPWKR